MTKEIKMDRKLFNLGTMDLEKFRDMLRITSRIIHETGLPIRGTRFDCGVIGFGVPLDEDDYVSYNIDNDWLFVNDSVLTDAQLSAVKDTANMFDLTIREFNDA